MNSTEAGYCPRCRETRTLRGTDSIVIEATREGIRVLRRLDLHCMTCSTFVSADETPMPSLVMNQAV